jgi:predicted RNase H-like HicB family nuclease
MPKQQAFFVKAEWDDEAKIWFVSKSDVPGLNAEAETPEEMLNVLSELIPELLAANGVIESGESGIPYSLMFDNLKAERAA